MSGSLRMSSGSPNSVGTSEDIGDFVFTQSDPYRKWVAEYISKERKVKSKTKTADEFFELVRYTFSGLTST